MLILLVTTEVPAKARKTISADESRKDALDYTRGVVPESRPVELMMPKSTGISVATELKQTIRYLTCLKVTPRCSLVPLHPASTGSRPSRKAPPEVELETPPFPPGAILA